MNWSNPPPSTSWLGEDAANRSRDETEVSRRQYGGSFFALTANALQDPLRPPRHAVRKAHPLQCFDGLPHPRDPCARQGVLQRIRHADSMDEARRDQLVRRVLCVSTLNICVRKNRAMDRLHTELCRSDTSLHPHIREGDAHIL